MANITPDTSFIENLVDGPASVELARTAYLVEDCSGGNPWLRERLQHAVLAAPAFPDRNPDELVDAMQYVGERFSDGLAEALVALGGLSGSQDAAAQERRAQGMRRNWDTLVERFVPVTAGGQPEDTTPSEVSLLYVASFLTTLGAVGAGVALADLASMQAARDGGPERSASMLRAYALDGQPTGSAPADVFFKGMHEVTKMGGLRRALARLETEWQQSHPGEPFYPGTYRRALAARSIRTKLFVGIVGRLTGGALLKVAQDAMTASGTD